MSHSPPTKAPAAPVQHYPLSTPTSERFTDREAAHYQAAQRASGSNDGRKAEAHLHLGEACGHIAKAVTHALAGRPHLAQASAQAAHAAYSAAVAHHQADTHQYGLPVRRALGLAEPELMAKADGADPAKPPLPPCPAHLHVPSSSGARVHPMSDEGVQHHNQTYCKPAADHGPRLEAHLKNLMHGLDVSVKHRVKEPDSLAEKVVRKSRPASGMGDILGARVTVNNPAHFPEAQRRLQQHMNGQHPMSGQGGVHIHEEEDSIKTPMASGYRSVHYNAQIHGIGSEIQLRHPHHTVWADYCHDHFYKDDKLKTTLEKTGSMHELDAVKAAGATYSKQVADHLHQTGGQRGPNAPKTPPILKKHGLGFPWDKLPAQGN